MLAVLAAVALAEQQLAALRRGDIDGFLARFDSYETACLALAGLPAGDVDGESRLLLAQLVTIDHQVSGELAQAMGQVSLKLASMRRGRNATGVYLAAGAANVTGVREG